MIDIKLDPQTHDIVIHNDLSFVKDIDYVTQKLKLNLWFFLGEWFLETSKGIPYIQEIMGKDTNISQVEAIIKTEILRTPYVNELSKFDLTIDRAQRKMFITFTVNTDFGITDMDISL